MANQERRRLETNNSGSCETNSESNYDANVLVKIRQCLENNEFCDLKLISGVDKKSLLVHRLILSTVSEHFHRAVRDLQGDQIVLNNVDTRTTTIIVKYSYSGVIDVTSNNLELVLETADQFAIPGMLKACEEFMGRCMNVGNCIEFYFLSKKYGIPGVESLAYTLILRHFDDLHTQEDFFRLSVDELEQLIRDDKLEVKSEESVFEAFLRWFNRYKCIERDDLKNVARRLLLAIRLPLIDFSYFETNVEPICDLYACQTLASEYFEWYSDGKPTTTPNLCYRSREVPVLCAVSFNRVEHEYIIEPFDVNNQRRAVKRCRLPEKSNYGFIMIHGERLFIIGGLYKSKLSTEVNAIDLNTHTHVLMPSMNTARGYQGYAVLNNSIYAVGGYYRNKYLNSVEKLNLDTDDGQWTFVASMANKRIGVAVTVLNNHLYAVGGRRENRTLRVVERYDSQTDEWITLASMLSPRFGAGATAHNGYLYVVGGCTKAKIRMGYCQTNSVERYDPAHNQWTQMASMKYPRDHFGIAVWDDYIYVVGGCGPDGGKTVGYKYVERYDPRRDQWKTMPDLEVTKGPCALLKLERRNLMAFN